MAIEIIKDASGKKHMKINEYTEKLGVMKRTFAYLETIADKQDIDKRIKVRFDELSGMLYFHMMTSVPETSEKLLFALKAKKAANMPLEKLLKKVEICKRKIENGKKYRAEKNGLDEAESAC